MTHSNDDRKHALQSVTITSSYPTHSRVHPLHSMQGLARCFVKREDELGFGITGSKLRKYHSLIPFFIHHKIQEVIVIGSAYSNNVLSLVQLLIENKITPTLFLKKPHQSEMKGNLLLTRLLLPEDRIQWIPASQWKSVESLAMNEAGHKSHRTFVLKEGASVIESLPGALTLPLDILRNEQECNVQFDHIFIESGTGLMAIAVILGYTWMQKNTQIHVIQLADDMNGFLSQLHLFRQAFEDLIGSQLATPNNFIVHTPQQAKSFGSTNSNIFQEIKTIARAEGFFTDPIYTAKLFMESRHILLQQQLTGNILINHSGGALSLFGFPEMIKQLI